jgi:hydrogenase expression/formation protein HypD
VPIVVTGFEPVDVLHGILLLVRQLEAGRHVVENAYGRLVARQGNPVARQVIDEVFEVVDKKWRGVGAIPKSGHRIRHEYRAFDAEALFDVGDIVTRESAACISGLVLRGLKKPLDCPAFGRECTPETPLGATMVSGEGACAAYHQYGRRPEPNAAPKGGEPSAEAS